MKLNSISEVVFEENRSITQASLQIIVEKAIIDENSKIFILAYSSRLLHINLINQFGLRVNKEVSKLLIAKGTIPLGIEESLQGFLHLFHQPKQLLISVSISLE